LYNFLSGLGASLKALSQLLKLFNTGRSPKAQQNQWDDSDFSRLWGKPGSVSTASLEEASNEDKHLSTRSKASA